MTAPCHPPAGSVLLEIQKHPINREQRPELTVNLEWLIYTVSTVTNSVTSVSYVEFRNAGALALGVFVTGRYLS